MSHHGVKTGRREFLKRGAAGLAGAALLPSIVKAERTAPRLEGQPQRRPVVRPLGKTGLKLPILGIGAGSYEPSLYRAALDRGVVHLDTSQYYYNGKHEALIGEIVKGRPRESFVVATSVLLGTGAPGAFSTFNLKDGPRLPEQFDLSLKRLGLDHVDIFYVAGVGTRAVALDAALLDGLAKIKAAGKARHVGLTTHGGQVEVIRAALESKVPEVLLVALNFKMTNREAVRVAIGDAAKAGVGVIVMKPMAGGFWDAKRTQPINTKAALKWALQDESVTAAVPGIDNREQLEADLAVLSDPVLTPQERADLKLDGGGAEGLYCAQCGTCLGQCPAGLDLPILMRSYMYAYGYRNLGLARAALDQVEGDPARCSDCAACRVRCASGFDVRERALAIAPLKAVPEELLAP